MKKFIFSLMFMMAAFNGANAMSFERAQAEALYLTDKMAYELNLNDQQYNDAYEINLDYFLSVDSPSDLYGSYYSYRLNDFRCILHDWQYSLLMAADYFLRPIVWRTGGWYFPIYSYYNRGYYYYGRPSVWVSYRGGHSRFHYNNGFYADRRPHWNGGLRGHDMHRPSVSVHHSSHGRGHNPRGNGYHIDMNGHRGGSMGHGNHSGGRGSGNHGGQGYSGSHSGSSHSSYGSGRSSRGNSFDVSSSRMGGGSHGSGMGSSRGGSLSGSHGGGGSRSGGRGGRR